MSRNAPSNIIGTDLIYSQSVRRPRRVLERGRGAAAAAFLAGPHRPRRGLRPYGCFRPPGQSGGPSGGRYLPAKQWVKLKKIQQLGCSHRMA